VPYRDPQGACPVCGGAFVDVRTESDRFERCESCGGVWLEWQTFVAMWARLSGGSREPMLTARAAGRARSCPECGSPMAQVQLRTVPIDHCGAHGVWFDKVELETSLAAAVLPEDHWFHLFARALVRMS
jgi:Zn-finger nucleic acid-binding protein